jgi:hypothetical protein
MFVFQIRRDVVLLVEMLHGFTAPIPACHAGFLDRTQVGEDSSLHLICFK